MFVALGLGSNLGAREEALVFAIGSLARYLTDLKVSSPYSTQALCGPGQPDFLNAVVVAFSPLGPHELLGLAKALEWRAGRRPGPRNGPRPLDVDLLVFGDRVIHHPELVLPHPQIRKRMFVLSPLAEVAPLLPIPPDNSTPLSLLQTLEDDQVVEKSIWTTSPI